MRRIQFLIILPLLFSCHGKADKIIEKPKTSEKPIISYAKRLRIEMMDGYSQVSVLNPWQGAEEVAQNWYLISTNTKLPSFIDSLKVIRVPVKKIICMSTTHLAMLSALGESGSVTGFSGTPFIYNDTIVQRVKKGEIRGSGVRR